MSPRRRVQALVALVALGFAGVAVGGALMQGRTTGGEIHGRTETEERRVEPPALELALVDRDNAEARALRSAERLYEEGKPQAARARFEAVLARNPSSVEAAVGAAVASWPEDTVGRLREFAEEHPGSAVVRLNLGLALFAEGDSEGAAEQWREAERREPDSPAALRAEDLLNADAPPGRPSLVLSRVPRWLAGFPAARRLGELQRRAERGREAGDWLLFASALESVGRRISARAAYDRAVALAPGSLEARVGAAVSRFDKDEPAEAFSRLGPLARSHPRSALVRFHLGLLLLWLPDADESRRQLARARALDRDGFYGRQAARVLATLGDLDESR
jgi:tetratricopeptide (TPR) repeat protein